MYTKKYIDFEELKDLVLKNVTPEDIHLVYARTENISSERYICPICGKDTLYLYAKDDMAKCYHCFSRSNAIDYHARVVNCIDDSGYISGDIFRQSLVTVARDFNIIDSTIAEKWFSRHNISFKKERKVIRLNEIRENKRKAKKKTPQSELKSSDVLNKVYEEISLREESQLTDNQIVYLKKHRGLSMDRINADYIRVCEVDARKFATDILISLNRKYGYTKEDLLGVPGFYLNKEEGLMYSGYYRESLGMKIRNARGEVVAIQIRKYDSIDENGNLTLEIDEKTSKYGWVTSSKLLYGCGPGAPVDVLIPSGEKYSSVVITEGKFKSEKVIEHLKSCCLSLQGVGNWRNRIEDELEYIDKQVIECGVKNIYVAFDADISTNLKVYRQCKQMYDDFLSKLENVNIYMVIWDQELGKGIDDFIAEHGKGKLSKIKFSEYIKTYEEKFVNALKVSGYKEERGKLVDIKGELAKKEVVNAIYSNTVLKPWNVYMA